MSSAKVVKIWPEFIYKSQAGNHDTQQRIGESVN